MADKKKDKVIISPDTRREKRIPPGQRQTEGLPVLHYGDVPENIDTNSWPFRIFGEVEEERELTYNEFAALEPVQVRADIHCVTRWSSLDNNWEGIPTHRIKELVKIKKEAEFVIVHAFENFTTNLPIDEFFAEDALFALKHEGKLITPEHGWPLRLVVPRLYFWKSAKWVTGVEFRSEDQKGFWEWYGYHNHGDPWSEERFD